MATEQINAVRYTCDSRCGTTHVLDEAEGLASGYHGEVKFVSEDGTETSTLPWYADKKGCVRGAVVNVANAEVLKPFENGEGTITDEPVLDDEAALNVEHPHGA